MRSTPLLRDDASDSGADTTVLGNRGWRILKFHPFRSANLIGFDDSARKHSLQIVTGATVVRLISGQEVIIVANQSVHNPTASTTLIAEFQVRHNGIIWDPIPETHYSTPSP